VEANWNWRAKASSAAHSVEPNIFSIKHIVAVAGLLTSSLQA
jgi:hypothetical protein